MVADIMNTEVVCTEQSEAAALGAAIQAAWSQSGDTLASLCDKCVSVDPSSRTLPVAANVSAYQQAYERYQQLVATL